MYCIFVEVCSLWKMMTYNWIFVENFLWRWSMWLSCGGLRREIKSWCEVMAWSLMFIWSSCLYSAYVSYVVYLWICTSWLIGDLMEIELFDVGFLLRGYLRFVLDDFKGQSGDCGWEINCLASLIYIGVVMVPSFGHVNDEWSRLSHLYIYYKWISDLTT